MKAQTYSRLAPSGIRGLAFIALWMLIFCIPWEDEFSVAEGLPMVHIVGVVALLAGFLAILVTRTFRRPHPAHYMLSALVGWMVLSYTWSAAPAATVTKAGSCVQLLLMAWLIWEFASTAKRQLGLLAAYSLGSYVSSVSVLYAFSTHTGSNLGLVEGRYTAAGFDENELGVTLALSIVMSGYLLTQTKRFRWVWLLQIPLALLAISLTGSRGATLATISASLILPFSFATMPKSEKRLLIPALLILLGIAMAVIPPATWSRLGTIQTELAGGTLTNRTRIWTAGWEVYREHPLLGVGAGAFGESVYSKLDIPYVAHNSYLSILAELGAIGALLFLLILATLFYLVAGLPRSPRRAWVILLLTWCVSVSSLTWEHRKPTWFVFGLLIAQAATFRSTREEHAYRESHVPYLADSAPSLHALCKN